MIVIQAQKIPFLGTPSPDQSKREVISYSSNRAPAYIPSILMDRMKRLPAVDLPLLQKLKEDIRNHVETRIQLIWTWFLLAHNSQLEFQHHSTLRQVGKGKGAYAAAHSSTLPCLGVQEGFQTLVFVGGSYFDDTQNATVFLPADVNKMDSRLDCHHNKLNTHAALRERTIEILNQVSQGAKSPDAAMQKFLKVFAFLIQKAEQAVAVIHRRHQKYILKEYAHVVTSYQKKWKDRMICKLCFRPKDLTVNADFFDDVQQEMYKSLADSMAGGGLQLGASARIVAASVARRVKPFQLPILQGEALIFVQKNRKRVAEKVSTIELGLKSRKYHKVCCQSVAVMQQAFLCLSMKPAMFKRDLDQLSQIRFSATIDRFPLTEPILQLRSLCLSQIRAQFAVQEPQKMGITLMHVLHELAVQ